MKSRGGENRKDESRKEGRGRNTYLKYEYEYGYGSNTNTNTLTHSHSLITPKRKQGRTQGRKDKDKRRTRKDKRVGFETHRTKPRIKPKRPRKAKPRPGRNVETDPPTQRTTKPLQGPRPTKLKTRKNPSREPRKALTSTICKASQMPNRVLAACCNPRTGANSRTSTDRRSASCAMSPVVPRMDAAAFATRCEEGGVSGNALRTSELGYTPPWYSPTPGPVHGGY